MLCFALVYQLLVHEVIFYIILILETYFPVSLLWELLQRKWSHTMQLKCYWLIHGDSVNALIFNMYTQDLSDKQNFSRTLMVQMSAKSPSRFIMPLQKTYKTNWKLEIKFSEFILLTQMLLKSQEIFMNGDTQDLIIYILILINVLIKNSTSK